jgi:hypothetical protein
MKNGIVDSVDTGKDYLEESEKHEESDRGKSFNGKSRKVVIPD